MEGLISRESLWEHMNQYASRAAAENITPNWNDAVSLIGSEPEVDAIRVVHGRWNKVHGYATPGGDPVWACSICGKGVHVYGVEHGSYGSDVAGGQWVSCPNCGAKMQGDRRE